MKTRAERYKERYPLVETVGSIEIRRERRGYCASLGVCLWSCHVDNLEDARDLATKANNLMELGFEIYGFRSVSVFDYDEIMQFVRTAHPQEIRQYWLYIR